MDRHSCPKCGHEVPKTERYIRNYVWNKWECSNCGTLLTFDRRPRNALTIATLVLIATAWVVRSRWGINLNWWTLGWMVFAIFVLVPLVDRIVVVDRQTNSACS